MRNPRIIPGAALLLGLDALFAACLALPGVRADLGVRQAILGALGLLLLGQGVLTLRATVARRPFFDFEPHFKKIHVLQFLCFQGAVMLYWGLSYPEVGPHLELVLVQLLFAALLDAFLAWALGRAWYLGFGVFPIVVSINLFLWFEHEYFALQLATVGLGVVAKMLVTWRRGEARRHIFNPSGIALACAAVGLLAFHRTILAGGSDFPASYDLAPNMYEWIFLVGLLVNLQFPTVLLMGSAIVTMALVDAASRLAFGFPPGTVPFSSPVLLGATLLITDPATTPESRTGKVLAGALYGLLVETLLVLLHTHGQPGYYDKVLAVPLVNLATPLLESVGIRLGGVLERGLGAAADVFRSHFLHVAVWVFFFVLYLPTATRETWPLIPLPRWIEASAEMNQLKQRQRDFCTVVPRACKPYGLAAELQSRFFSH